MDTVPRAATVARAGRRGSAVHVAGAHAALGVAEVRRDVGGTTLTLRGVPLGGVLGVVDGQVAHLETVGHVCGCCESLQGGKMPRVSNLAGVTKFEIFGDEGKQVCEQFSWLHRGDFLRFEDTSNF